MAIFYALLENKTVVPCDDIVEWAQGIETNLRNIKQTHVRGADVSTIFTGVDFRHNHEGPPLVFETMIFGGEYDKDQMRCSTYMQALEQHEEAVKKVKGSGFFTFLTTLITGTKP